MCTCAVKMIPSRTYRVSSRLLNNFTTTQCFSFHKISGSHLVPCQVPRNRVLKISQWLSPHEPRFNVIRFRYSFVYSKKPFSILNARLSSLNSERMDAFKDDTPLTKSQADDLVLRLTEEERASLLEALQAYESNRVKAEYEGQLAATRWRSKLGRPSKLPTLGDVDPTGSYCHLTEDWLKKKYAENVPRPTSNQLLYVSIHNAIPFVGFGFLDNFIMILAGDYIELKLGAFVTLSTMAAAALGNTISDVLGIGSAWYVELAALKVGLKPPNLSPIQLDMSVSRRAANLGRALGITIGCLLGMLPLLFMEDKKSSEDAGKPAGEAVATTTQQA